MLKISSSNKHSVTITDIFRLQEKKVIEGIKVQLQNSITECFEHVCVLQEARQQLLADLQVRRPPKWSVFLNLTMNAM